MNDHGASVVQKGRVRVTVCVAVRVAVTVTVTVTVTICIDYTICVGIEIFLTSVRLGWTLRLHSCYTQIKLISPIDCPGFSGYT